MSFACISACTNAVLLYNRIILAPLLHTVPRHPDV